MFHHCNKNFLVAQQLYAILISLKYASNSLWHIYFWTHSSTNPSLHPVIFLQDCTIHCRNVNPGHLSTHRSSVTGNYERTFSMSTIKVSTHFLDCVVLCFTHWSCLQQHCQRDITLTRFATQGWNGHHCLVIILDYWDTGNSKFCQCSRGWNICRYKYFSCNI